MRKITWTLLPFAVALLALAFLACDSDEGVVDPCDRSLVVTNPDGKQHGERCESNDECRYGLCYRSSSINGGTFGICTKDCSCGDATTTCAVDNPDDPLLAAYGYLCYRPPLSTSDAIDTLGAYCVPECRSRNDQTSITEWCQLHDAELTACTVPYGTRPVCTTAD